MSEVDNTGVGFEPAGDATPDTTSTPTPIELKNDSFVKIPGQEKPVQFDKWYRGLQGELTRKSQAVSSLTERVSQAESKINDMGGKYSQALDQIKSLTASGRIDKQDALEAVKQLPYLTGEQAAQLVGQLKQELGGVSGALTKRDEAILLLAQITQEMRTQLGQFTQGKASQDFDSKIKGFVKDAGYGDDLVDFAKELYLAYEGDDLDQEFPSILANRVKSLQTSFASQQKKAAAAAKPRPWVPGKGGNASPSQPLRNKFAKASPKEITDSLWDTLGGEDT